MAALGTRTWVERTGGKLAWHHRLTLLADGVMARAATQKRIRSGLKLRHREVNDILPPDSAIAREAVAMSEDACEPFLHNHNLRAWFWARLLDDGVRPFDDEATFVALMLHDLGLTESHRLHGDREQCFTIIGARAVDQLAARHGWSDKRAALAAEAITLHLNVTVADRFGKEAQMVRAGSGADVAGLGLDVLHQDQIDSVVSLYPRHHFKREIAKALSHEVHDRPCCRIAIMQNKLGFGTLIRRAPMFGE
jgi:hypothetical protein